MPNFKATPEHEAAVNLLVARLATAQFYEVLTYADLSGVAHLGVKQNRYLLDTARRRIMQSKNMVFGAVVGVGIKRLDDVGIAGEVSRDLHRVHRAAYRGIRKGERIADLGNMTADTKTGVLANMSCLAAIAVASKPITVARLEAVIVKTQARLSLEETLKAFGG